MQIKTILFPSRPHADTIFSIFLLRKFGEPMFVGVSTAVPSFSSHIPEGSTPESLLEQGILLLDSGGGDLDHHNRGQVITLSELMLQKLGLSDDPAFEKIIAFIRRDDLEGKGTISTDPLDRAFGLSGLITVLNKVHGHDHLKVVEAIIPLFDAFYSEESKRTKEMPKEVEDKLKSGKAEVFNVRQRDKNLKVIIIESDNPSLTGFLRSRLGGAYDVVAQWSTTGHLNIMTRPTKKVDLRSLVALVRAEELKEKGSDRPIDELAIPGKLPEIPEWFYDFKTNTLQNGAMAKKDVPPTKIERITLRKLLEIGLSEALWKPSFVRS